MDALLHRTKGQYDEYRAGKRPDPPVVDILIISGGGDWGAFGAGFLKGWGRVPRTEPLARPDFAIVTGVSTGALIAPFAFLGDEGSINLVEHLYRNPKPDWVKYRGWLYFLPSNISFAEVPGLEREVDAAFTMETARRIEEAGADGRVLMVNTTNIDDGSPRVFDLVAEARRARQSGNLDRIRNVILASAGIPGAFPFRIIDDGMYVDGGVTGNIIYGGRVSENDTLAPQWQAAYPDIPIPKVRFWVLFNNQFRPPPQVIDPRWPAVITRAMETSTRAATTTAIRHLFSIAENSRLKWHADTEVRVASIPGDWLPPKPGTFVTETMNALADLGEKMGADPNSWKTSSP
ncbi:MAG TPA: patatin-like phospholipase family protein [Tepidisphaeraceae bacterium]|nr:patatin-like phospholipase family protein [Tepidisphaeraceae bacterium]